MDTWREFVLITDDDDSNIGSDESDPKEVNQNYDVDDEGMVDFLFEIIDDEEEDENENRRESNEDEN